MKKVEEVSLGFLGARFQNIKLYLFTYDGTSREDILEGNRMTKETLGENECGLTSYISWANNYSEPRILILVNTAKPAGDPKLVERLIKDTLAHEVYHALGKIEKRYNLTPGCEILARAQGYATWKFQVALEAELGYELKKKEAD